MSDSPERFDLYSTPVWHSSIAAHAELKTDLVTAIRAEQAEDPDGQTRSNVGSWRSGDGLHRRAPFDALALAIGQFCATVVAADLGSPEHLDLTVDTMWANVSPPGSWNARHEHGVSLLSAVYYVDIGEGAGVLKFADPRGAARILTRVDDLLPNAGVYTQPIPGFRPVEGHLFVFPGWFEHEVLPNESSRDRISISLNVSARLKTPPPDS